MVRQSRRAQKKSRVLPITPSQWFRFHGNSYQWSFMRVLTSVEVLLTGLDHQMLPHSGGSLLQSENDGSVSNLCLAFAVINCFKQEGLEQKGREMSLRIKQTKKRGENFQENCQKHTRQQSVKLTFPSGNVLKFVRGYWTFCHKTKI